MTSRKHIARPEALQKENFIKPMTELAFYPIFSLEKKRKTRKERRERK
jgi:hypothetical protein